MMRLQNTPVSWAACEAHLSALSRRRRLPARIPSHPTPFNGLWRTHGLLLISLRPAEFQSGVDL